MIWDMTFCLIAFDQAIFSDKLMVEDNFLLFIFPALVFLLMFMNLEFRVALKIYEANFEHSEQQKTCIFNSIVYGSQVLWFPILYFTNLSNVLFVFSSFIFMPQIYSNAVTGKRPNPHSPYYN